MCTKRVFAHNQMPKQVHYSPMHSLDMAIFHRLLLPCDTTSNRYIKVALLAQVTHISVHMCVFVIDFTLFFTTTSALSFFTPPSNSLYACVCFPLLFGIIQRVVNLNGPFFVVVVPLFVVVDCHRSNFITHCSLAAYFSCFFSIPIHFTLAGKSLKCIESYEMILHIHSVCCWVYILTIPLILMWDRGSNTTTDWSRGSETTIAMLTIFLFTFASHRRKFIWFFSYSNHTQSNIINMKRLFFFHIFMDFSLHSSLLYWKKREIKFS